LPKSVTAPVMLDVLDTLGRTLRDYSSAAPPPTPNPAEPACTGVGVASNPRGPFDPRIIV